MHLVGLVVKHQLFPDIEQEVKGVLLPYGLELVAELEPILLEREDVELAVVEIAVHLVAVARERPLVQMAPDGRHDGHHLDVGKIVV